MNDKQWERSNYQVAFLAAVIGLGAFKEELSSNYIGIFSVDLPWILVFLPLMGLLLLGAFLSAFTVTIIDGLNITRLPLSGMIMRLASACNILACMWPVLLFGAWCVQWILWVLRHALGGADASFAWLDIIGTVLGFAAMVASYRITTRLLSQSPLSTGVPAGPTQPYANVRYAYATLDPRTTPRQYAFIEHYNTAIRYMQDYLRLRGYGVRTQEIDELARMLQDKGVLSADDVRVAYNLQIKRIGILYHHHTLTSSQLDEQKAALDQLTGKVADAYLEVLADSGASASLHTQAKKRKR